MTKSKFFQRILFFLFILIAFGNTCYSQENKEVIVYKNQFSTNLILPLFESVDLSYERTIANKWAVGLAVGIYGDRISEIGTYSGPINTPDFNYELMPFGRLYFQGAQKKSHFLEIFGSLSIVEDSNSFIRNTNEEGYGVYELEMKKYALGGMGIGYGYRFLLPNNKWVLEAQFGIRTNFDTNFILLDAALVRTGIKIGYRF